MALFPPHKGQIMVTKFPPSLKRATWAGSWELGGTWLRPLQEWLFLGKWFFPCSPSSVHPSIHLSIHPSIHPSI